MMGIFYPNFLMLLPSPRPVTCFAPPLQAFLPPVGRWWVPYPCGSFAPCGPFGGCAPCEAAMPCAGPVVSCPPREAAMPPAGLLVSCPPREAALPPVGHYVNAHYNFSTATCQTRLHWVQFTVLPLARLFHWFQFTALPLARLYRMSISLQRCHCQTLLH